MSLVEFASPAPRRIRTPRWLDLRLVLGIALVLAAVLIGATVLAHARHTDKALVLTRDLAAGSIVRTGDVRTIDTQLPADVRAEGGYLSDASRVVGKVLTRPVGKGELLPAGALSAPAPRTTLSVPFSAGAAPALTRGQRIVVWLSTRACPSVVLLPDVTVQDVHTSDTGSFSTSGTGQDVVVDVAPDLAQRVVTALSIENATLRAGVLAGPATASTRALPDLDRCAPATP